MRILMLLMLALGLASCSYGDSTTDFEDWYVFRATDASGRPVGEGWVGFFRLWNDVVAPPDVPPDYEAGGILGHWMVDRPGSDLFYNDEAWASTARGRIQMDDTLRVVLDLPNPSRSFTFIGLERDDVIRGRWELAEYGAVTARGPFTARLHRRARREAPGY